MEADNTHDLDGTPDVAAEEVVVHDLNDISDIELIHLVNASFEILAERRGVKVIHVVAEALQYFTRLAVEDGVLQVTEEGFAVVGPGVEYATEEAMGKVVGMDGKPILN